MRTAPDDVKICFDNKYECVESCVKDICERLLNNGRFSKEEWRKYKECVYECEEQCDIYLCYEVMV